jgi:hypothetical protein
VLIEKDAHRITVNERNPFSECSLISVIPHIVLGWRKCRRNEDEEGADDSRTQFRDRLDSHRDLTTTLGKWTSLRTGDVLDEFEGGCSRIGQRLTIEGSRMFCSVFSETKT